MTGAFSNSLTWFFSRKWLLWLSLVLAYLSISLFNGYPLLYSDTATYISSGFELDAPADRPIVYGIFLRLCSVNGLSLFFVPVIQTILFLYSLYQLFILFFDREQVLKQVFFLALIVLLFSGFGWCINLLLPDMFTSIGFIFLFCILASNKNARELVLLFFLFFISASSHISNVPVFCMIALAAFLFKRLLFPGADLKGFRLKSAILLCILGLSYIIMGAAISKSRHAFLMGSMAQKGILQEVLKDKCSKSNFRLCAYKDSIPRSFEYFVWNTKSPLARLGGWKATKKENREIIGISFSESKYLAMHLKQSGINFIKQLGTLGIGEGTGSFGSETLLITRIKRYTVLDGNQCLNTRQFRSEFTDMNKVNGFYLAVIFAAVLCFIFLTAFSFKKMSSPIKALVFLSLVLILSNCALVAFTSEVSNRFGCRLSWLILLLDFVLISRIIQVKKADSRPGI